MKIIIIGPALVYTVCQWRVWLLVCLISTSQHDALCCVQSCSRDVIKQFTSAQTSWVIVDQRKQHTHSKKDRSFKRLTHVHW